MRSAGSRSHLLPNLPVLQGKEEADCRPNFTHSCRRSRPTSDEQPGQMRSIFDAGHLGLILIGMPGIEKRIARFPQFYSRIGFVHEFRPLCDVEMQELLERRWTPAGVRFSEGILTPEVIARLIRITSGNLRLLTKLLTQIERVLSVNDTPQVSVQIVEAARDSLVIGQACILGYQRR